MLCRYPTIGQTVHQELNVLRVADSSGALAFEFVKEGRQAGAEASVDGVVVMQFILTTTPRRRISQFSANVACLTTTHSRLWAWHRLRAASGCSRMQLRPPGIPLAGCPTRASASPYCGFSRASQQKNRLVSRHFAAGGHWGYRPRRRHWHYSPCQGQVPQRPHL